MVKILGAEKEDKLPRKMQGGAFQTQQHSNWLNIPPEREGCRFESCLLYMSEPGFGEIKDLFDDGS